MKGCNYDGPLLPPGIDNIEPIISVWKYLLSNNLLMEERARDGGKILLMVYIFFSHLFDL